MSDIDTSNLLNLIRAAAILEQRLSGALSSVHGLSPKEVFLMLHLDNEPGGKLTRAELSRRLHVSASTVTRMAAPLEKIGLVSRLDDERDARLVFVLLTETGKTRIEEVKQTLARHAEQVFKDRWTKAEVENLKAMLDRIVSHAPGQLI